jgi:hypothetical protein
MRLTPSRRIATFEFIRGTTSSFRAASPRDGDPESKGVARFDGFGISATCFLE